MEAATHPGMGHLYSRLLLHAEGSDGADSATGWGVDRYTADIKLSLGLHSNLAVVFDGLVDHVPSGSVRLAEVMVRAKYRLLRMDLGPTDTWRTSALAGVMVPVAREREDALGVRLGVASTAILGRHGLNATADWMMWPKGQDEVALNASYLFRLAPAEYGMETEAAWYVEVESLNTFAGSVATDAAAGLLYEAQSWAAEVGLRVPLGGDTPSPSGATKRVTIAFGLRYLF